MQRFDAYLWCKRTIAKLKHDAMCWLIGVRRNETYANHIRLLFRQNASRSFLHQSFARSVFFSSYSPRHQRIDRIKYFIALFLTGCIGRKLDHTQNAESKSLLFAWPSRWYHNSHKQLGFALHRLNCRWVHLSLVIHSLIIYSKSISLNKEDGMTQW